MSASSDKCPRRSRVSAMRTAVSPSLDVRCPGREQRPQPSNRPEQVHTNRRFVEPRHGAHFSRRLAIKVAQHKNLSLPVWQLRQRGRQLLATFAEQHLILRARTARRQVFCRITLHAHRVGRWGRHPALPSPPRLQPVEASVDQDARKPDLEGQVFTERAEVDVGLHESVLHRLISVRRLTQVMKRDPDSPTLVTFHDPTEDDGEDDDDDDG